MRFLSVSLAVAEIFGSKSGKVPAAAFIDFTNIYLKNWAMLFERNEVCGWKPEMLLVLWTLGFHFSVLQIASYKLFSVFGRPSWKFLINSPAQPGPS